MTIIYIGDFLKSYATENYITHAFRQLGHKVVTMQETLVNFKDPDQCVNEILEYRPDIILFSKGRPQGRSEEVIEMLKEKGVKTVCWLFDLYFDLPVDRKFKLERKYAPFNSEIIFSAIFF